MACESSNVLQYPTVAKTLFDACLRVNKLKGFKLLNKNETEGTLVFATAMTWFSWGETICIRIHQIDSFAQLEVRSECKLKTTIADWGKNKRNVNKILELVAREIQVG
jgi:hypothetical protein